jgi:hypothetical protein
MDVAIYQKDTSSHWRSAAPCCGTYGDSRHLLMAGALSFVQLQELNILFLELKITLFFESVV